jgi:hypothetical protein
VAIVTVPDEYVAAVRAALSRSPSALGFDVLHDGSFFLVVGDERWPVTMTPMPASPGSLEVRTQDGRVLVTTDSPTRDTHTFRGHWRP